MHLSPSPSFAPLRPLHVSIFSKDSIYEANPTTYRHLSSSDVPQYHTPYIFNVHAPPPFVAPPLPEMGPYMVGGAVTVDDKLFSV